MRSGRCEIKLESPDAQVNAVKFMGSGEMLGVAGCDGIVSERVMFVTLLTVGCERM